jgi:hypothetical protein
MQATDSNPEREAEAAEERADGGSEMGDRGSKIEVRIGQVQSPVFRRFG